MIDYYQTRDMTIHYILTDFSFCQQFTRNTFESQRSKWLAKIPLKTQQEHTYYSHENYVKS